MQQFNNNNNMPSVCAPAAPACSSHAELTTEESHAMFKQFAEAWNLGRLPLRFYQGLAAAPLKRTTHNWGIKARPSRAGAAGGSVSAAAGAKLGMAAFLQDQKQQ